ALDEPAATANGPAAVTGPPRAGVLPPRRGWRAAEPGLPEPDALRALVSAAVAEFRTRTGELAPEARTRAQLDTIGRDIWSRTVGDTACRSVPCTPPSRWASSAAPHPPPSSPRAPGCACGPRTGRSPYGARDSAWDWDSACAERAQAHAQAHAQGPGPPAYGSGADLPFPGARIRCRPPSPVHGSPRVAPGVDGSRLYRRGSPRATSAAPADESGPGRRS